MYNCTIIQFIHSVNNIILPTLSLSIRHYSSWQLNNIMVYIEFGSVVVKDFARWREFKIELIFDLVSIYSNALLCLKVFVISFVGYQMH